MASTITFSTSTSIKNLIADGDLLYGYSSTNGTAISSQHDHRTRASLAANGYWKPWSTTYWKGYFSIDKDRYNHANVIGISWEKTGYPGYWYMYQKSIIADDPNNNEIYGFNSAEDKFQTSAKGGYRLG